MAISMMTKPLPSCTIENFLYSIKRTLRADRFLVLTQLATFPLQVGMNKLLEYLEGEDVQFSADEFMDLYTYALLPNSIPAAE